MINWDCRRVAQTAAELGPAGVLPDRRTRQAPHPRNAGHQTGHKPSKPGPDNRPRESCREARFAPRQAAEAVKSAIFQFRTGAGPYREEVTREKDLAKAIEDITGRLARSAANTMALPIYSGSLPPRYAGGEGDDGMSPLGPDRYIEVRLDDQLKFFRTKAIALDTLLERLQWGILGIGGLGTLLAAFGFDLWVALTTAIATALVTYLSYRQVDPTVTHYNQTAIDLENIKGWWTALRLDEQGAPANVDALVQHTEQVLATELSGWTQRMQDALANLRRDKEKETDDKVTERTGRSEVGPSLFVAARSDTTPAAPSSQLAGAR